MAATRLSDVIVSSLWTPVFVLEDPAALAFFRSGVVAVDPIIEQFAKSDSNVVTMRHLKPLDGTISENLSSDDPAAKSTPNGAQTGFQNAVKIMRNQSWASMDLVAAFFTPDPVSFIRSQVANYWVHRWQVYIASVCAGITLSNIANNAGDMVYDATGNSGDAALISGDAILLAKQSMGDRSSALGIIVMHSVLYTSLQRQQLIVYLRDGEANVNFPTYLGYRIVQDDDMPVVNTGTSEAPVFVYTSYMFAPGFIRWGTGQPKTPTEVKREPDAGNGEGEEIFWNRQHWIGHPLGFSYALDPTQAAGANPSNATLATAAAWTRKFPRKLVPFVAIKTKG